MVTAIPLALVVILWETLLGETLLEATHGGGARNLQTRKKINSQKKRLRVTGVMDGQMALGTQASDTQASDTQALDTQALVTHMTMDLVVDFHILS